MTFGMPANAGAYIRLYPPHSAIFVYALRRPMTDQSFDSESVATAVGEVGMAWGHVQRALLSCRRSGWSEISQIAVELNGIGIALTGIEDRLRQIFQSSR